MIGPGKKDGRFVLSLRSLWNRSIGREEPPTKATEPNWMALNGSAVDSGFHSIRSETFTGGNKKISTPFGGAEFN
jgi:hypothetical protein